MLQQPLTSIKATPDFWYVRCLFCSSLQFLLFILYVIVVHNIHVTLALRRVHFGYCEYIIPKATENDSALRYNCHCKLNLNRAEMIYEYNGVHTILCKIGPW